MLQNNPYEDQAQNSIIELRLCIKMAWTLYEKGSSTESLALSDQIIEGMRRSDTGGDGKCRHEMVEVLAIKGANLIKLQRISEAETVVSEID